MSSGAIRIAGMCIAALCALNVKIAGEMGPQQGIDLF
jgi:hypothetical protein